MPSSSRSNWVVYILAVVSGARMRRRSAYSLNPIVTVGSGSRPRRTTAPGCSAAVGVSALAAIYPDRRRWRGAVDRARGITFATYGLVKARGRLTGGDASLARRDDRLAPVAVGILAWLEVASTPTLGRHGGVHTGLSSRPGSSPPSAALLRRRPPGAAVTIGLQFLDAGAASSSVACCSSVNMSRLPCGSGSASSAGGARAAHPRLTALRSLVRPRSPGPTSGPQPWATRNRQVDGISTTTPDTTRKGRCATSRRGEHTPTRLPDTQESAAIPRATPRACPWMGP